MGENWKSRLSELNGYIDGESTIRLNSETLGEVTLERLGTGRYFAINGSPKFVKAFKSVFVCRRRDSDRAFVFEDSMLDNISAWLIQVCGKRPEVILRDRRHADYNARLARLLRDGETAVHTVVKQRVGQNLLREELLRTVGKCEITGVTLPELLWVSHIKDWSVSTDEEKLDLENVLLLAKNWDALFDKKFISFDPETGRMVKSSRIDEATLIKFGVPADWATSVKIPCKSEKRRKYLKWHLEKLQEEDARHE